MKTCPECKADLSYKHGKETYYHTIGIEDPYLYDGISWWFCPKCTHAWKRFEWSPDPETSKTLKEFRKSYKKQLKTSKLLADVKKYIAKRDIRKPASGTQIKKALKIPKKGLKRANKK